MAEDHPHPLTCHLSPPVDSSWQAARPACVHDRPSGGRTTGGRPRAGRHPGQLSRVGRAMRSASFSSTNSAHSSIRFSSGRCFALGGARSGGGISSWGMVPTQKDHWAERGRDTINFSGSFSTRLPTSFVAAENGPRHNWNAKQLSRNVLTLIELLAIVGILVALLLPAIRVGGRTSSTFST